MRAPDPLQVHVEPLREFKRDAGSSAVRRALEATPRHRPVAVLAQAADATVQLEALQAVRASHRQLIGQPAAPFRDLARPAGDLRRDTSSSEPWIVRPSKRTVTLRPGWTATTLQVPREWMGATIVVVTRLLDERSPGPAHAALGAWARAAGCRGSARATARAGDWLARHTAASVVVVAHGLGRIVAAALPRDAQAFRSLDAWLARRVGRPSPLAPMYRIHCPAPHGRGIWRAPDATRHDLHAGVDRRLGMQAPSEPR